MITMMLALRDTQGLVPQATMGLHHNLPTQAPLPTVVKVVRMVTNRLIPQARRSLPSHRKIRTRVVLPCPDQDSLKPPRAEEGHTR